MIKCIVKTRLVKHKHTHGYQLFTTCARHQWIFQNRCRGWRRYTAILFYKSNQVRTKHMHGKIIYYIICTCTPYKVLNNRYTNSEKVDRLERFEKLYFYFVQIWFNTYVSTIFYSFQKPNITHLESISRNILVQGKLDTNIM